MFLRRVLTNAPPLPGLTCWKYRMVNRLPSTRMAEPFLNWLVDIMLESSPSRRSADCGSGPSAIRAGQLVSISAGQHSWPTAEVLMAHRAIGSSLLRDVVNPAQTPRYYRTVSSPVSRTWRRQLSGCTHQDFPGGGEPDDDRYTIVRKPEGLDDSLGQVPGRGDVAVGAHAGDYRIH